MGAQDIADFSLETLLPHRGAMLLIDDIVEVDAIHAVTRSRVRPTWPLADEGGVHPLILVELAAQTAGVCNGWERIHSRGTDSDAKGWLVAVKRASFAIDLLPFGGLVTARADNSFAFDSFREIRSQLHLDGTLAAEIVLQIYQA